MTQSIRTEAAIVATFLASRKLGARIVGGFAAPAFYVYQLDIAPNQPLKQLTESLDALQSYLYNARVRDGVIDINDPAQRVVVRFSDQPPALEVSRPQPQRLNLSAMPIDRLAPFTALAGVTFVTRTGQPITWRLDDPGQPHALVAGMSGSGKSNLLLSLIFSLCHNTDPAHLTIYIADGGNSSLLITERLHHVARTETDAAGIADLITHVVAAIADRKQRSATNPDHRILLVVDELANLLAVMRKPDADALQQNLATIAAEGRKFGVHLLAATQKPLAEVTGSLTKSNMAVRFVGAVASNQDSNTALSVAGAGAERLAGRGDFIVRSGMFLRRFQAPYVDQEIATMRAINRRWPHVPTVPELPLSNPPIPQSPNLPLPPSPAPTIPPHVLAIFRAFDDGNGALRRGWKSAAVTALNNGKLPTGTVFQKLGEQADACFDAYLLTSQQKTPEMPAILRMAVAK
jgi:hypothetical protein